MRIKNIMFLSVLSVLSTASAYAANSGGASSTSQTQALQQLGQLQLASQNMQQPASGQAIQPLQVAQTTPAAAAAAAEPPVNTQPADVTTTSEQISEAAFNSVTSRLFPLTTTQVVQLRQMYDTSELAKISLPSTPPRPTATSQFVNLATGSTPPVIRLAQGFVSSLVFLDSTGAPWPLTGYDVGDPQSFNIVWDKGNTLMIQSKTLYTYGNLAVRLQGLNTPVMMTLIPGQKAVDYRVDLRVQGYGPNANMPTSGQNLPSGVDSVLLNVLDGVPPPGSKLLDVIGGEAQAWSQGSKLYVRTRLTILSPGWVSFMSSADGMNAYEMPMAPVLLVSWHGKVIQLKIEG